MGIRLLSGRDLTRADVEADMPSVLVNETFARLFLPKGLPLGRRFTRLERTSRDSPEQHLPQEVVGLVGDARYNDLRETTPPTVYLPLRAPRGAGDDLMTRTGGTLAIRSVLPANALASARTRGGRGGDAAAEGHRRDPAVDARGQHDAARAPARVAVGVLRARQPGSGGGWPVRSAELLGRAADARDRHPDGARRRPSHRRAGHRWRHRGIRGSRHGDGPRRWSLAVAVRREAAVTKSARPTRSPSCCR